MQDLGNASRAETDFEVLFEQPLDCAPEMMSIVQSPLKNLDRCIEAYQKIWFWNELKRVRDRGLVCNAAKERQGTNRLDEGLIEYNDVSHRGSAKPGVRQPRHILQQPDRR